MELITNEGKSAQVSTTTWRVVSNMFCNFYFMKNNKIAKNSTTTNGTEKNNHRFGIFRILEKADVCMNKFKNNQILLYKISCIFSTNSITIYWVNEPHSIDGCGERDN
jgi:hypothetical protein